MCSSIKTRDRDAESVSMDYGELAVKSVDISWIDGSITCIVLQRKATMDDRSSVPFIYGMTSTIVVVIERCIKYKGDKEDGCQNM